MTIGFIIAGGSSSRMGGGDKTLSPINGTPILARTIACFAPQVDELVLNTNEPPTAFAAFDLPIIADAQDGREGPLAGLLRCLEFANERSPAPNWIATVPSDCPFLPRDLVRQLLTLGEDCEAVVASSVGRTHPLAGIWRPRLLTSLRRAFEEDGVRSVMAWLDRIDAATLAFDAEPTDPFFNVNTPSDLARAEEIAKRFAV